MKRISAFLLLLAFSSAWPMTATAQIFTGPNSARQAQKAANKERKASEKQARKQMKAMRKYEKAQQKLPRKTH
jgi:hypothetical protein